MIISFCIIGIRNCQHHLWIAATFNFPTVASEIPHSSEAQRPDHLKSKNKILRPCVLCESYIKQEERSPLLSHTLSTESPTIRPHSENCTLRITPATTAVETSQAEQTDRSEERIIILEGESTLSDSNEP